MNESSLTSKIERKKSGNPSPPTDLLGHARRNYTQNT